MKRQNFIGYLVVQVGEAGASEVRWPNSLVQWSPEGSQGQQEANVEVIEAAKWEHGPLQGTCWRTLG